MYSYNVYLIQVVRYGTKMCPNTWLFEFHHRILYEITEWYYFATIAHNMLLALKIGGYQKGRVHS